MHETTLPCLCLHGFLLTHTPDAFPVPASLSLSLTNYWGSSFFFAGACELALDAFPVLASPISVLGGLSSSSANSWGSSPVSGRLEEHKISPPMNLWTSVFVPDDLVGPDPCSRRTCTCYFSQVCWRKKAGEIAPFEILARIHFNLQVAVCPAKIWSVLCTYHNYINPNSDIICRRPPHTGSTYRFLERARGLGQHLDVG